jgi:hypothetical protein
MDMPRRQFEELATHAFPERVALWYYRMANVVWLWIAFAVSLGFVQWRIDPSATTSAFDQVVRDQVALWTFHLGGLVAGLVLFAGVWFYRPRLEILGHCLLTGFILATAAAVVDLAGVWPPINVMVTASVALASAFRVVYLVKFTPGSGR